MGPTKLTSPSTTLPMLPPSQSPLNIGRSSSLTDLPGASTGKRRQPISGHSRHPLLCKHNSTSKRLPSPGLAFVMCERSLATWVYYHHTGHRVIITARARLPMLSIETLVKLHDIHCIVTLKQQIGAYRAIEPMFVLVCGWEVFS